MTKEESCCKISDDDLRYALKEIKTYVDITEEDLKKIYEIALKHAESRLVSTRPVGDLMTRNVKAAKIEADIREVAVLLAENRISGLPVIDDNDRVVGIVSETDILCMAGVSRKHTFKDLLMRIIGEPQPACKFGKTAADVMTSPAVTISPGAHIKDAAKILDERQIKRLPVVDDENRLVGIISRADIVRAMGQ